MSCANLTAVRKLSTQGQNKSFFVVRGGDQEVRVQIASGKLSSLSLFRNAINEHTEVHTHISADINVSEQTENGSKMSSTMQSASERLTRQPIISSTAGTHTAESRRAVPTGTPETVPSKT